MIILTRLSLFLGFISLIFSCSDECTLVSSDYPCRVREATVTEFNPKVNIRIENGIEIITPVPSYSIHTLTFPSSGASSGNLTNDERFEASETGQYLVLGEKKFEFNNQQYKIQLIDKFPSNTLMIGDMMVVAVDTTSFPFKAAIRFKGYVTRFPMDLRSDDASRFCDELKNYRVADKDYENIRADVSQYGENVAGRELVQLDNSNIRVLDASGEDVTGSVLPPLSLVEELLNSQGNVNTFSYNINVEPGDFLFYRAINGKEFAVLFTDIRSGNFEPNLKRVTIKFSEIRGIGVVECPEN